MPRSSSEANHQTATRMTASPIGRPAQIGVSPSVNQGAAGPSRSATGNPVRGNSCNNRRSACIRSALACHPPRANGQRIRSDTAPCRRSRCRQGDAFPLVRDRPAFLGRGVGSCAHSPHSPGCWSVGSDRAARTRRKPWRVLRGCGRTFLDIAGDRSRPVRGTDRGGCVGSNAVLGVSDPANLHIFGSEPGVLGNPSKHSWSNFLAIVKREDVVWPFVACQCLMRSRLALDTPPDLYQGSKDSSGL